jgi:acylglycerol lipase
MCEPVGSLRTTADMLSGAQFLDSRAAWDHWPADLPLLLYHGGEDAICCPKAAVRFGDRVVANDKTIKILDGLYHEPHNELAPEPAKLAKMVGEWILKRAGEDEVRSKL